MKIGVIPDVHGSTHWEKNIENFKDCDKIVFLGDYVDSFNEEEKGLPALANGKRIIEVAKSDPRIDLLVGNHEFENYWFGCNRCSGFQMGCYEAYHQFFEENADMFKIAVEYDGWVFSHAGFTKTWVEDTMKHYKERIANFEFADKPIEFVNALLKTRNVNHFAFSSRDITGYGDSIFQGPLWVRPSALFKDYLFEKQVIGHTETRGGEVLCIKNKDLQVVMCDTASHSKYFILDTENPPEFLSLEDANRKAKEQEKEFLRERGRIGEKKKLLRDKYNLTKSEMNRLYLIAECDASKAAESNQSVDLWEHLDELCSKEAEKKEKERLNLLLSGI